MPAFREVLGIGGLIVLVGMSAAAAGDETLAQRVPADVGLFIELRDAGDLLVPLVEPQVWLTLAELAGQPAAIEETQHWRQRVQRTVGMSPVEAIRTLFSQRVAFLSEGPRNTRDAVIVCQPQEDRRALVRRWDARPLPAAGRIPVFRLPYHVGLAVHEDLMLFGDHASSGIFDEVLGHLDSRKRSSLAEDPDFSGLLQRVPPDPDGLMFVRLDTGHSTTQPIGSSETVGGLSNVPSLLRGSQNLLLALHRHGRLLHISAVGDAQRPPAAERQGLDELVTNLPETTLVAWAGYANLAQLSQAALRLPERSVFRITYQLHEKYGNMQRFTDALDSAACVALGSVVPATRLVNAPPIPAVAVLLRLRDPAVAVAEWREMFNHTIDLYNLVSMNLATPPQLGPAEAITIGEVEAQQLDLNPLIGGAAQITPLGEIHLSWAHDGDVLIVASHSDWLRQILAARRAQTGRLAPVFALSPQATERRHDTLFVAQPGPLADLATLWLEYFEQALPFVLDERWWRNYQPGGGTVHLGIQVAEEQPSQRLRVVSITPNSPADGVLKPGDEIVGSNQRRFATSQPVREMRRALYRRPNARWIDLLVERERMVLVKRVPLSFVDPVETLRRLIAVGRVLQRVVYYDDAPDGTGTRGHLTLELREDEKPLFDYHVPASQPATSGPTATAPSGS